MCVCVCVSGGGGEREDGPDDHKQKREKKGEDQVAACIKKGMGGAESGDESLDTLNANI